MSGVAAEFTVNGFAFEVPTEFCTVTSTVPLPMIGTWTLINVSVHEFTTASFVPKYTLLAAPWAPKQLPLMST